MGGCKSLRSHKIRSMFPQVLMHDTNSNGKPCMHCYAQCITILCSQFSAHWICIMTKPNFQNIVARAS